jgi:hypothetical protein
MAGRRSDLEHLGTVSERKSALFDVARRSSRTKVFIDLDDKPVVADVVRNGYKVPTVLANKELLREFVSGLEVLKPTASPRVLNQSIAPGTKVGVGTEINLVMAASKDVRIGIFDGIHVDVKNQSVAELLDKVKGETNLRSLVLKYETVTDIKPEDKTVMATLMKNKAGMTIDETKDGKHFRHAYQSMRAAYAFG